MRLFMVLHGDGDAPRFMKDGASIGIGSSKYFPLVGITRAEVEAGLFNLARTESGEYFLTQEVKEDNRALVFLKAQGGYKGWVIPSDDTTGRTLSVDVGSSTTGGALVGLYLLEPGQSIILSHTGRRIDDILIYSFVDGELRKEVIAREKYLTMQTSTRVESPRCCFRFVQQQRRTK